MYLYYSFIHPCYFFHLFIFFPTKLTHKHRAALLGLNLFHGKSVCFFWLEGKHLHCVPTCHNRRYSMAVIEWMNEWKGVCVMKKCDSFVSSLLLLIKSTFKSLWLCELLAASAKVMYPVLETWFAGCDQSRNGHKDEKCIEKKCAAKKYLNVWSDLTLFCIWVLFCACVKCLLGVRMSAYWPNNLVDIGLIILLRLEINLSARADIGCARQHTWYRLLQ